ncbi:hypothetical protein Glove_13g220 [Diversispora epigaea]|uniref:TLDc domain-containing protein n=1 Tax=Diversispora epigaea TaxID=1348612 RepID=A0A397JXJ2_9GLOM|nr:hypothetical protein Glove_13g220 [Diversispora epigaea]
MSRVTSRVMSHKYQRSFSTIISEEHAAEISSLIDRKTTTYSTTNIPYKFELILSGTRDEFAPQPFWNIFHGHANTVVEVKVKGTDEILGDNIYNGDELGIWTETEDSFIFSLKNEEYYEKPIRTSSQRFSIVNYEVFKVIKKNS